MSTQKEYLLVLFLRASVGTTVCNSWFQSTQKSPSSGFSTCLRRKKIKALSASTDDVARLGNRLQDFYSHLKFRETRPDFQNCLVLGLATPYFHPDYSKKRNGGSWRRFSTWFGESKIGVGEGGGEGLEEGGVRLGWGWAGGGGWGGWVVGRGRGWERGGLLGESETLPPPTPRNPPQPTRPQPSPSQPPLHPTPTLPNSKPPQA